MTGGARYRLYARPGAGSLAPQILLEEYRRINPTGKIPSLVLPDGTAIAESAAILIHLTEAHPEAELAPPPGSSAHGRFLQWMVFLSANVYEAALRYFYAERYAAAGSGATTAVKAQALADYGRQLEFIGGLLSPYVLGAKLTAADPYLHMLAGWYPGGESGVRIPKLAQHAELLRRRPATRRAESDHAENQ